jgi:hypothetical protein
MRDKELRAILQCVIEKLDIIIVKLNEIPQVSVQVSCALLPTINALKMLNNSGTASRICQVTGRTRATESMRLNELHRMGIVKKERNGRNRVFILKDGAV